MIKPHRPTANGRCTKPPIPLPARFHAILTRLHEKIRGDEEMELVSVHDNDCVHIDHYQHWTIHGLNLLGSPPYPS